MGKFKLSQRSLKRLEGVEPDLVNIVCLAIERTPVDFGVAWMGGLRTPEEQNQLYKDKVSTKDGYLRLSKHQFGEAVDLQAFVGGKAIVSEKMQCVIAGVMFSCAAELGETIRWGGDWDSDGNLGDQTFNDLYHFEIIRKR